MKVSEMACCRCGRRMVDGFAMHRINEKGVAGIWACTECLPKTDGLPIDDVTKAIMDATGSR